MSTHQTSTDNTRIARRFIECLDASDTAGALDLLADDAIYWLAGKPSQLAGVGPLDKTQIADLFRRMGAQLTQGLRMKVSNSVAEGDQVALEVESHGVLKNGRVYNNEYHMLFKLRGGKISLVKEYYDTFHVWDTWYRREAQATQAVMSTR